MDALRRRLTRYVEWLESQATHHEVYAVVLRAVAHRLTRMLEEYPAPRWTVEYGVREGDRIVPVEEVDGTGEYYARKVTAWRRTNGRNA